MGPENSERSSLIAVPTAEVKHRWWLQVDIGRGKMPQTRLIAKLWGMEKEMGWVVDLRGKTLKIYSLVLLVIFQRNHKYIDNWWKLFRSSYWNMSLETFPYPLMILDGQNTGPLQNTSIDRYIRYERCNLPIGHVIWKWPLKRRVLRVLGIYIYICIHILPIFTQRLKIYCYVLVHLCIYTYIIRIDIYIYIFVEGSLEV